MGLGLYFSAQTIRGTDAETIVDESIQLTHAAHDVGFDSIAFGQHYLSDCNQLQPSASL